jgi:hypothetical protein
LVLQKATPIQKVNPQPNTLSDVNLPANSFTTLIERLRDKNSYTSLNNNLVGVKKDRNHSPISGANIKSG